MRFYERCRKKAVLCLVGWVRTSGRWRSGPQTMRRSGLLSGSLQVEMGEDGTKCRLML